MKLKTLLTTLAAAVGLTTAAQAATTTPVYLQNLYHTGSAIDGWANWYQGDSGNNANIPGQGGATGSLTMNGISLAVTSTGGNFKPSVTSVCDGEFPTDGTFVDVFGVSHASLLDEIKTSLSADVDISQVLKTGLANGAAGGANTCATISGLTAGQKYVFYFGCGTYGKADTNSGPGFQLKSGGYGTVEDLQYVVTVAYNGSDSGMKATTVANTYQSFSATEVVRAGSASGKGGMLMIRAILTPNADGKIIFYPQARRSVLSFVAIAEVSGATTADYAATISESKNWTALDWNPDWPEGGAAGAVATVTNTAAAATLTINENETAKKLAVVSDAGNDLTIALADGVTATIATYDFSGAAGKTTVGFGTGTSGVTAGADTVLSETGTGTLTIGSDLKATVPAWGAANVAGAGTIDISADSASTAVTWGETANFTGTMRLLKGTWTVSAGNNSAGYPRKSAVEVVGSDAMLKLTTANDATGYNGDLSKSLTIKDGGTFRVEKRDTFSRTMNLVNGGQIVLTGDDLNSGRSIDMHGGAVINVSGSTPSVIGGTTAGSSSSGSGIVAIRRSGFTVTVESGAELQCYSAWSTSDGSGGNFIKAGAGKMVQYRDSSSTLPFVVNGGTIKFVNGGRTTTGNITLNSGYKLELSATDDGSYTLANAITGAGRIEKQDSGTYTLTGANTYTGGTTVSAGTLAAATANLGTGAVTVNSGATLKLTLTSAQVAGETTLFTSSNTAEELTARVTTFNAAGTAIPGVFTKGENDAVVFTPSVEFYTLDMTDGNSYDWSGNIWTKGGESGQSYAPAEGKVGDVTITVNGTATLNVTGTPASLGSISFNKADGAETAVVTVKFTPTTLPESSAANVTYNVFGLAPTVGDGVTYSFEPTLDAKSYAWECNQSAGTFFATKRPTKGSINIKIGPRTSNVTSSITPDLESVGANPLSGLLWTNAKLWNNNNSSYTDFIYVDDASGSGKQIQYVFRGPNTYFNSSNPQNTGNAKLTASYVDDGDTAASTTWEVTNPTNSEDKVTLPAAENARGWQIHLGNLPYAAFDLYFITASDQAEANLKETPIKLSADGGATWVCYTGDSDNHQTKIGEENWKGSPYATGAMVEAKNYLKMRVSAAIMGVDKLTSLEITHGTRNTGSYIRSGLAAIQIVELDNDGVFTLAEDNGNWTTDAIWSSGGVPGKTWLNDGTAYAKIAADGTIASVTLDAAVNAQQVTLTGDGDFTFNGTGSMTTALGFDMSKFWGMLTMNAPIGGEYSIASGKLTLNNADATVTLGGTASNVVVNAGTLKFASKSVVVADSDITVNGGTLDLNGLDIQHAYTLAGGALVNNGNSIGNNLAQMNGLTVTGDATIGGSGDFGLIAWGYGENELTLGANTLTKTGANNFWLCNTTISGTGTIQVDEGTFAVSDSSDYEKTTTLTNGTLAIGTSGTLLVKANKTFAVKTLKATTGATITNNGTITLAEAEDVDFSNVGGTIAGLDGAITVKGTVKTTSGKFGSANITVADGAKIDLVIDASATEATITTGTLTFPDGQTLADCVTINGGSSATWKIKENGKIYDASRQAYYAATVSEATATWSSKDGLTKTSADDWVNGVNSTITLASATADAILTFDVATTAATLKVTGAANLTLKKGADIDVQIAAIDLAEATGTITIDFNVGAATIASGASTVLNAVGTGNITVAEGNTLTVKASGLKASQVTNNGTIRFEGGTEANPIAITGNANFGFVTLGADTYVRNTVDGNHVHNVVGEGATSCYALTKASGGVGFTTAALTNLTIISDCAADQRLWIERMTYENIRLVANTTLHLSDLSPTILSLKGTNSVTRAGSTETLTITCEADAEFEGASTVPFTIGAGAGVQTLSGAYTGALTVNEGGKAALKVGADYALNVNNAGTLRLIDNETPKTTLTSATFNNAGTLDLSGTDIDTISIGMFTAFGTVTWPDGVDGTVKLACGDTRDLTDAATKLEGFAGAKEFSISETLSENLTGKVSLTGVPAGAKIVLTRLVDGSVIERTVTEAGALDIEVTPLVYGKACLFDFTFTNTVAATSSKDIAPAAGSRNTNAVTGDSNAEYTNYDEESQWYKALKTKVRPYMGYKLAAPYTVAVAGCFPSETNTCLVSVGSAVNCVFLASGKNPNEVVLVRVNGHCPQANNRFNIDNCEVLATMTVPNSATTMHSVVFETADMQTVNIYLDGTKWSSYHFKSATELGTGFQIGGFYTGSAYDDCYRQANDTTAPDSYVSAIRIYDSVLNQAAISQFAKEFEYVSPSGEYTRTIADATATWSQANAWTFSKDETTVDAPAAGGIVKLTASAETTIAVNLADNVGYEELTLTGDMTITTNSAEETHGGKISASGKVKVDGDVTLDYAAVDISGSPLTLVSGSVCFDLRAYDASNVFKTIFVQMTGLASEEDKDNITAQLPANQPGRTFSFGYDATHESYGMTITVTPAPFVYTIAQGGEGAWSWNDAPIDEAIVAAQTSGGIEKMGDGVAALAPQNGMTYNVKEGTLKFTSAPTADCLVTNVAANAAFDVNGLQPGGENDPKGFIVTLNGGTLKNSNSGAGIVKGLTLITDSTVDVSVGNLWMQSGSTGYSSITLALGEYTLTKTGDGQFGVVTTTVTGTGTIDVTAGELWVQEDSNFGEAIVKVGANGTFHVRGGKTATVANITGVAGANINNEGTISAFTLAGSATLSGNGVWGTNTLDNATIDVGNLRNLTLDGTGTVNVVVSDAEIAAEGPITVFTAADGSKITCGTFVDKDGNKVPGTFVDGTITVDHEAKIGTTYYLTLAAALDAVTDEQTVELLTDVTFAPDGAYAIAKDTRLNLDGHNLTGNGGKTFEVVNSATLYVMATNSTVTGVRVNVGKATDDNGSLYIGGGTWTIDNDTLVHVNGTCTGCGVNIQGATMTSAGDNAIQLCGGGTYLIEGCTITGATAVYVKAGNLSVKATLVADGEKTAYKYSANGANATGDALVIDNCGYPEGPATVMIQGGTTLTSAKADKMGYYVYNASEEGTVQKDASVDAPAPAGYKWNGEGQLTKIVYATLTITQVENCTISVTNAEGVVQTTGATFDRDLATKLYVTRTPAEGYVLVDCEATETITMDADVTVTATVNLKPVDPFPEPEASDDPIEEAANVETALDEGGFSDTAKENITTKDEYDEFKVYCQNTLEITAPGGTTGNVKDNAYLSYALDAGKIDKALTAEDVTVSAFEATDGGYDLTIAIEGVTVGENVTAEKIATVVEITANTELDASGFSADKASVSGHCETDGKIKVTVAPAEGTPSAFFYKSAIKK